MRASARGLTVGGRPLPADARVHVLAAGKAAAPMAAALERAVGERLAGGLAVTREGHAVPLRRVRLLEASHPVPDARSEAAGRSVLRWLERIPAGDVLVALLSGGASSLLSCPLPGLRLDAVARTTELLLRAGASIDELNCVRKHLLELCGGRAALACAAHRIELGVLSDVLGDRLDVIASGPFTPDPTRYADALAVVDRSGVRAELPREVLAHLEAGARGELAESPKPGAEPFGRVHAEILASNRTALLAARDAARARGLDACVASERLSGEARLAGRRIAALGRALRSPALLLFGGETTVRVRGPGRGGRCQELALAAALELEGASGLALLAAGTDGSDGPTDVAGAFADGGSAARGRAHGVDAREALSQNDSYAFFAAEGGHLQTGPTGTNVMDLILLLRSNAPVSPASKSV